LEAINDRAIVFLQSSSSIVCYYYQHGRSRLPWATNCEIQCNTMLTTTVSSFLAGQTCGHGHAHCSNNCLPLLYIMDSFYGTTTPQILPSRGRKTLEQVLDLPPFPYNTIPQTSQARRNATLTARFNSPSSTIITHYKESFPHASGPFEYPSSLHYLPRPWLVPSSVWL